MELTIDLKDYDSARTVFKRTAARGIIRRGDLYLLIHSNLGECKFPGGGVDDGETLVQALIREVQEETGRSVVTNSVRPYGVVHERRRGKTADVLEMESHYFLCDVSDGQSALHLDEYEAELGFQAFWISLDDAICKNKEITDTALIPWNARDTMVMEYLLSNYEVHRRS